MSLFSEGSKAAHDIKLLIIKLFPLLSYGKKDNKYNCIFVLFLFCPSLNLMLQIVISFQHTAARLHSSLTLEKVLGIAINIRVWPLWTQRQENRMFQTAYWDPISKQKRTKKTKTNRANWKQSKADTEMER